LGNERKFDPAISHGGEDPKECKPQLLREDCDAILVVGAANFVPAAAVIRRRRVLFVLIGHKGHARRPSKQNFVAFGCTEEGFLDWKALSLVEDCCIPSGGVKSDNIGKTLEGKGSFLYLY